MKNSTLSNIIPWFIGGIAVLVIGLSIRIYPLHHNQSSDEYEQATLLVISKIKASITQQVNAQFPGKTPPEKQQIIQSQLNELLRQNKQKLYKTFDQVNLQLLKKNPEAKHYLQESDSYYFLDLTQNILKTGDVSRRVNGSQYFNEKMLAPVGYWEPQTWHPYIGAWVYKTAKLLNPGIDIMTGVGYTPLVLLPLTLIAFLLACRGLGCAWPSALTASIFFILAPIYLQRSTYGWYDNDTYSVLFPALNLGLSFFALRSIDNTRKTIFWSILAGLSFALFARFWTGWGFSWMTTLGILSVLTIRAFLYKEQHRKNLSLALALIAGATLFFLIISIGLRQFLDLFPFAAGELKKFILPGLGGWPDLFIVVGELKHSSLRQVILLTGGPFVFLTAILTAILILKNALAQRRFPSNNLILLGAFTAISLILALKAERFTILFVTPLALVFAYGLESFWRSQEKISSITKLPVHQVKYACLALLFIGACFPAIISNNTIGSLLHPIFNSAWDRALTQLREKTPANSIVDTWWSPGHFVKAIGQRRVTFDGASIKGEQGYWLTKVYLSQNETEALGVLRMLNTSSNQAVELLQKNNGWPLSKSVATVSQLTKLTRPEASKYLKKIMPAADAKVLIKLTHGNPPPSYLLIYNENVEGNVLLSYLGKWNFERIEQINQNPELAKKVPAKGSPLYIDFLWNLVGGQWRQSESLNPLGKKDTQILFDQGVTIDTTVMTGQVNSPKFGRGIPASIVYFDESRGRVVEKKQDGATLTYSLVYYKDKEGTPHAILMDTILANSLIMKLYYFNGKGLEHFKLFSKEQDLSGRTKIFIYEVKWPNNF
ncbi:MAG: STT3 domain-containing protein [Candidatus Omnitrophota bacterium]